MYNVAQIFNSEYFYGFWSDYLNKAFWKIKPVSCIIRKFIYFVQLTDIRGLDAGRNLILEKKDQQTVKSVSIQTDHNRIIKNLKKP